MGCCESCLAGPKGKVTAFVQAKAPQVFDQVPKLVLGWVCMIFMFITSPYWGHGSWFGEFEYLDQCWHRIPIIPSYCTMWWGALYLAIYQSVEMCTPDAAKMISCCSKETWGATVFVAGLLFLVFRIISWIFFKVLSDNVCGWNIWAYWSFWIQIFIGIPVGFIFYVCIFPSGSSGAAAGPVSPQQYQKMETNGAQRL